MSSNVIKLIYRSVTPLPEKKVPPTAIPFFQSPSYHPRLLGTGCAHYHHGHRRRHRHKLWILQISQVHSLAKLEAFHGHRRPRRHRTPRGTHCGTDVATAHGQSNVGRHTSHAARRDAGPRLKVFGHWPESGGWTFPSDQPTWLLNVVKQSLTGYHTSSV